MTETRDTHLLLQAFCEELGRCGVRHACTSPGSRSAPLVLSLVREPALRCWSHIDERAAGFFALGVAKASGMPAVVACTSGTAAANYLPAVVEAHHARVPLIVLTADRPPELRDNGAGQAIDQVKLFGGAAKWFVELGSHSASPERLRWIRGLACRAVWTALEGRPGVVHINIPLREPLILDEALGPAEGGRAGGAPWIARGAAPLRDAAEVGALARQAERPIIVAGRLERSGRRLVEAAQALRAPLLADPLSRVRSGPAAIAHYDLTLRDPEFADAHRPDLVVRIGDLPTSKPLRAWLAGLDCEQVAVDPEDAWQDPASVVSRRIACDPGDALAAVAGAKVDTAWWQAWRERDEWAARRIEATLGDELSEPRAAAELALLGSAVTVLVGSSMPIRDVETFWPLVDTSPRVLSNRGANGIDGTISTAYGVAAAADGPVVALLGDVTLAHDLGGLLAARRLDLPLAIVLLDNGGGGIFDFLPVATQIDVYEEHVATPTGLDFERVAELFGCAYTSPSTLADYRAALRDATGRRSGTTLIHVRSDRAANLALHRRVAAATLTS